MRRAKAELLRKIHGGQICQIVHCMARLKIADALRNGPLSTQDLATAVDASLDPLRRLCKALVALKLLEVDGERFALSEEGRLLLSDAPDGLHAIACFKGDPLVWDALAHLHAGIKSGESPFQLAHGRELFDVLEEFPERSDVFHDAMDYYQRQSSDKILELYDFSHLKYLVDVGGGRGGFLTRLLDRQPQLQGCLFELPHVLRRAKTHPRMQTEAGSFFEDIPAQADAYVLRNILHDWDDGRCSKILAQLRQAMRPGSRLLIFESVVDSSPEARIGRYSDLNMFLLTAGGRERSEEELQILLHKAGLQHLRTLRCTGSKALLEVQRA